MSRPVWSNQYCFFPEFSDSRPLPAIHHRGKLAVGGALLIGLIFGAGTAEAVNRHGLRGREAALECRHRAPDQGPPPFAILGPGEAIHISFLAAPERPITTRIAADGRIYWPYSEPILVAGLGILQAEKALGEAAHTQFIDPDLRIRLAPADRGPTGPADCRPARPTSSDVANPRLSPPPPGIPPDGLAEDGSDGAERLPGSAPFVASSEDELAQTALHESLAASAGKIGVEDGSNPAFASSGDAEHIVGEAIIAVEPVIAADSVPASASAFVQPLPVHGPPPAETAHAPSARTETGSVETRPDRGENDWFGTRRARSSSRTIIP